VNHRLGHDFKLYPGDLVDGFLFGESASTIQFNYSHLMKIPVELTVFAGSRDSYGAWMTLVVNRETQRLRSPAQLRCMTGEHVARELSHVNVGMLCTSFSSS